MNKRLIGKNGEDIAENLLTSQNYKIVSKNYSCRFGEIDIVAIDRQKEKYELVFVEVKTRTSDMFGEPEEAMNFRKKNKILKTIGHFFGNEKFNKRPLAWRIDLIAIKLEKEGEIKNINHYKNI